MRQGHRVSVRGLDGDALPGSRDRTGEGDRSGGRREHRRALTTADVDAAVLSGAVRMRRIEHEGLQDGPASGGPGAHAPAAGARRARPAPLEGGLGASTSPLLSACCLRRERSDHGRDGRRVLSNEITELSQRAAVEVVPGTSREARNDLGRCAARRARLDEVGHGRSSLGRIGPAEPGPSTSVISPFGGSPKRSASSAALPRTTSSNRFVSSRQTTAPLAPARAQASERSECARRLGDSKATTGQAQCAARATALRAHRPCAAGSRRRRSGRPPRPLRTSAVSTAEAPGSTVTAIPALRAARTSRAPGSDTPGRPASETRAIRSPASSRGHELGDPSRLVVLVVGEQPRLDAVALQQAAGMSRVLGQHEVGLPELGEHSQRHVVEVPDRCRADRERH